MARKRGMPEFKPTAEQRKLVSRYAGILTWDELAALTINPRTKKSIAKTTLRDHFDAELAAGTARLKWTIAQSFFEQVTGGNWSAIQFGLRHIFGYRDDTRATIGVSAGGDVLPAVNVHFVVPDGTNDRPLTNGHATNGHGANGHDAV